MARIRKVPVVMQMETSECGVAALSMILAYYGKWLSLEQLRADCGVSRDGSNARSIVRAARKHGLNAKGWRISTDRLAEITPCIIHWKFNHFVVFKGFKGGKAYINDPAVGSVAVSMEEFNVSFTGVALEFSKGKDFKREGHETSIFRYIKNNLSNAKTAFAYTLLIGLMSAFAGLLMPVFSQVFFDSVLNGENANWTYPLLSFMTGVVCFMFLLNLVNNIYDRRYHGGMSLNANTRFLWHILNLPLAFFGQRYVGDLIQRQSLNESITLTLIKVLAPFAINVMLLFLYVAIMLKYSVPLTLLGISVVLLNVFALLEEQEERVNCSRAAQQSEGNCYGVTMSCIDNIESIKAAGAEEGFFEYWSGHFANMNNKIVAFQKHNFYPYVFLKIVNTSIFLLGGVFVIKGELTIGMLMAFLGFVNEFIKPAYGMLMGSRTVIDLRSQMERIDDVLSFPVEKHNETAEISSGGKLSGLLELKNVTFGYNPNSEPLIKDVSIVLEPGKSIAFVGGSGSGKSTLAKLITGLYKPWQGEILFDGKSIDSINHYEFVNSVAVIDQKVVLFEDTIAANIKMWDNSIEDFTITMACNDACIRKEIMSRPQGFNTLIRKGGMNFSTGQRQRMEIATALSREPVFLIMDEATSALDAATEEKVMRSIKASGATLIIIAHRMSTVRDCDQIVVLDKGQIVQKGTHDELISRDGMYKNLMEND